MGMSTVCVHGLGYIGLPTAAMLANYGHDVIGYDPSEAVIDRIERGSVDQDEPGLQAFVAEALDSGTLSVGTTPLPAEYQIISVPTPITEENEADLSYVRTAAETVGDELREDDTVILESTVPPGTTTDVVRPILEQNGLTAGETFSLAYCPETVLPGNILYELQHNDRIVGNVGTAQPTEAVELYETFVDGEIHTADATTAETAKLVQNAHRDLNIAFANEIAKICDVNDIDSRAAIKLANTHPRVDVLNPGPGVGGHCLPVDPHFLVDRIEESVIKQARMVNQSMVGHTISLIEDVAAPLDNATVAVLGVAYKGGVADTRNSPGLRLARQLQSNWPSIEVRLTDPHVDDQTLDLKPFEEAVRDADVAVLITDHDTFGDLGPADFDPMATPKLVDTRGVLDQVVFEDGGFDFVRL